MPQTRHRGPRLVPATPIRFVPGKCALMSDILGRVLWIARQSLHVSQQEVSGHLYLPASTVSKLELGTITQAVHHLDAFADAYTYFDKQLRGRESPGWEGWELHFVATTVARALTDKGWKVVWAAPDDFDDLEQPPFVTGRKLVATIKSHWPEQMRSKVGW